ncbi:MAG: sulfur carrier protein ThiS [Rhodobacteraceae bacterium]|nr:sulfur carrier protein ThiS [Paracoccaceae bacterium]
MKILVNAETKDVSAHVLSDILVELGYGDVKIATALNAAFVAKTARAQTQVVAGDRLEIVTPRQGG